MSSRLVTWVIGFRWEHESSSTVANRKHVCRFRVWNCHCFSTISLTKSAPWSQNTWAKILYSNIEKCHQVPSKCSGNDRYNNIIIPSSLFSADSSLSPLAQLNLSLPLRSQNTWNSCRHKDSASLPFLHPSTIEILLHSHHSNYNLLMLNPVNMAHSSFSLISHLTLMTMPYLKLSLFLLPVIPPSSGVHLLPLDPLLFTSFLGLYPLLCNGHWWLVHT